jgi:hypothetical protein
MRLNEVYRESFVREIPLRLRLRSISLTKKPREVHQSKERMLIFDEKCKGMTGFKQKSQTISGLNKKICKVFSGRVRKKRVALGHL